MNTGSLLPRTVTDGQSLIERDLINFYLAGLVQGDIIELYDSYLFDRGCRVSKLTTHMGQEESKWYIMPFTEPELYDYTFSSWLLEFNIRTSFVLQIVKANSSYRSLTEITNADIVQSDYFRIVTLYPGLSGMIAQFFHMGVNELIYNDWSSTWTPVPDNNPSKNSVNIDLTYNGDLIFQNHLDSVTAISRPLESPHDLYIAFHNFITYLSSHRFRGNHRCLA